MQKTVITTSDAPKAIGPYSQAVRWGDLLFASGQIPINPSTGKLVDGGIEAQTRQAMDNLKAVLRAGESSIDRLIKVTIFLADIADFAIVNGIYGECFSGDHPARCCVEVAQLPLGARIEIDGIAGV